MLHFLNDFKALIPEIIAMNAPIKETINVMFCSQTWVVLKNEMIKVSKDTIALVDPTSEVGAGESLMIVTLVTRCIPMRQ
jgi:hypothetical protein